MSLLIYAIYLLSLQQSRRRQSVALREDILITERFCFILSLKFRQNLNHRIKAATKTLREPISTPIGGCRYIGNA